LKLTYLVDICITTTFKDLEHVCHLAALLAKRTSPVLGLNQSN
jgi:hypothetical protein